MKIENFEKAKEIKEKIDEKENITVEDAVMSFITIMTVVGDKFPITANGFAMWRFQSTSLSI